LTLYSKFEEGHVLLIDIWVQKIKWRNNPENATAHDDTDGAGRLLRSFQKYCSIEVYTHLR
jgi:hypothetical protein